MTAAGVIFATTGALLAALATGALARRDGTGLTALLATTIAATATLTLGLARPTAAFALGISAISFLLLSGPISLPASAGGVMLAGVASWFAPSIALGHLALTLWTRERIGPKDAIALLAALLVATLSPEVRSPARLLSIVVLGISAVALRRYTSHRIVGPGSRKVLLSIAAALPLLALVGLFALEGRTVDRMITDMGAAWVAAAGAVLVGSLLLLTMVGVASIFSTENEIRVLLTGAAATGLMGGALIEADVALTAIMPLALSAGVGAHLLLPSSWRAGFLSLPRQSD